KDKWSVFYGGEEYSGYWGLAAALRRAIEESLPLWDATYLAELTGGRLARILRGRGELPMLGERLSNLREVGRVLLKHWDGQFARAVEAAEGSALRLVETVAERFPSFRDVPLWKGRPVPMLKRAQILAVDLAGTFNFERWGKFNDLASLTAFADYKLPQILRAWGILEYDEALAQRVDARRIIPSGDPMEVEIRAATIGAVERLRQALNRQIADGRPHYKAYEVDWALWAAAQGTAVAPYHLTRTIYY
ncbi:MAG TPA: queuosine salvage family protein, partial [Candidatus Xenobia bacterium]